MHVESFRVGSIQDIIPSFVCTFSTNNTVSTYIFMCVECLRYECKTFVSESIDAEKKN